MEKSRKNNNPSFVSSIKSLQLEDTTTLARRKDNGEATLS